MGFMVGGSPGTVYTEADQTAGKCPTVGTVAEFQTQHVTGPCSGTFIMCKAGASQNLVNGHIVSIARAAGGAVPDWVAVIAPAGAPGTAVLGTTLGIAVCSVTASASMALWVQVYGRGVVKSSVSINPNVPLQISQTTAGIASMNAVASASALVDGLVLLNTSSTQGSICACFINYPHFVGSNKSA